MHVLVDPYDDTNLCFIFIHLITLIQGQDFKHEARTWAPDVLILLASRLWKKDQLFVYCSKIDHDMQVLYPQSNDLNTYSSLFSLLHCGKTSANFWATSFSHLFHDKLKKTCKTTRQVVCIWGMVENGIQLRL